MLTNADRARGGKKGGKSTSAAKRAAAARNGRNSEKSGRPRGDNRRTLAEFLLRRKLNHQQHGCLQLVWHKLDKNGGSRSPRTVFKRALHIQIDPDNAEETYNPLATTSYIQPRRLTTEQELVIASVKAQARLLLKKD